MVSAIRTIPKSTHRPWRPASSCVRVGLPPRLVFLSPGEIKRTSGSRIEPVLDDESANSAVFQRSVVSHQRGLVPDRRTRDHQIKVALLPTNSFELRTLSGVSANNGEAQRQHGKVSVICLMRAPFCSLRTDFSASKSNSARKQRNADVARLDVSEVAKDAFIAFQQAGYEVGVEDVLHGRSGTWRFERCRTSANRASSSAPVSPSERPSSRNASAADRFGTALGSTARTSTVRSSSTLTRTGWVGSRLRA
jgi:hypothetical protein